MVKKAVIPAAGLGTKFLPATKAQPKEMLPIIDKPAIQYVVEEAVDSGIDDILIIIGRGKRAIEDHFDRNIDLENFLQQSGSTDALQILLKREPIYSYQIEGKRYDLGTKIDFIKTNIDFSLRRPEFAAEIKKYLSEIQNDL